MKMGDPRVHLREWLTCGYVVCRDSSTTKHATKRFHAINHPMVRSFEFSEDRRYRYVNLNIAPNGVDAVIDRVGHNRRSIGSRYATVNRCARVGARERGGSEHG